MKAWNIESAEVGIFINYQLIIVRLQNVPIVSFGQTVTAGIQELASGLRIQHDASHLESRHALCLQFIAVLSKAEHSHRNRSRV